MNSHQAVTIYISAASDLMAERETLARMIAELPVTLAWRIVQTPTESELLDLESLLAADLYVVLMGSDIRAPVGLELMRARQSQRPIVAFAKRGVTYTPAGQVFIQQAQLDWRPFRDAANLSRQVQRLLSQHLLDSAFQYQLTPAEVIQLEQLLTTPASGEQTLKADGAGHSAVILSRERYQPSEGVIVGEPDER
jgi:uncharacterized NAD(P)/FAD-binding protein YdhS